MGAAGTFLQRWGSPGSSMGGEAHPGDAGASPSSTPGAGSGLCSLLSLQDWFSVKREADYVPEGQLVVLVEAAGCHGQGVCFWPLGGGGQRCCSRGCNTRDSPLPSLSRPPPPPDPPTPPPPTTRSDAAPSVRPGVPPISAHQELRAPHQIIQRRADRSSPASPASFCGQEKSSSHEGSCEHSGRSQSPRQSKGCQAPPGSG